MENGYFQLNVTEEQKLAARKLVEYSLAHHKVANIWDKGGKRLEQTRILRYTGTLGEIVFADAYHLPRPARSFGAADGQDFGQDFWIQSDTAEFSIDIKSMKRKTGVLSGDYVLNIPASQLHKPNSKTTHYFCVSLHQSEITGTVASMLGFIEKQALIEQTTGILYRSGTMRIRKDQSKFTFYEDTYEVLFKDIIPPVATNYIQNLDGFRWCSLVN